MAVLCTNLGRAIKGLDILERLPRSNGGRCPQLWAALPYASTILHGTVDQPFPMVVASPAAEVAVATAAAVVGRPHNHERVTFLA